MPEGNVFLSEVAVVEVLTVVLALGSSRAGFFGRRLSCGHRGIVTTRTNLARQICNQETDQMALGGTEKGASLYDVENFEMG
jgi:hypothetical protein